MNPHTPPASQLALTGSLAHIRWQNAESGFFIGALNLPNAEPASQPATIKGTSPAGVPRIGAYLSLQGAWVNDPKYGEQFAFTQLSETIPPDTDGMARYLETHTGGIGAKRARAIVDKFGEQAFTIIAEDPAQLVGLAGITDKQALKIQSAFSASSTERASMTTLYGWEVGPAGINAIKDHWQGDLAQAVTDIKVNPYLLSRHVVGFGFLKADRVALRAGVPLNSPFRVQAAFVHCLEEAARDGHTWVSLSGMMNGWRGPRDNSTGVHNLLGADPGWDAVRDAADTLIKAGAVEKLEDVGGYALPRLLAAEHQIAKQIDALKEARTRPWTQANPPDASHLNDGQTAALAMLIEGVNAMVLTGGAGTGKTTALRTILDTAVHNNISAALCAPTGKAAKRMSEATGRPASTIHRLLAWGPRGPQVGRVKAELLVVDEASMVDVELMAALLSRIEPEFTRLLLVGDWHQLPPVGPGAPFRDIIVSQAVPICELTQIMRTAADSIIPANSRAVLAGDVAALKLDWKQQQQMFLIECEDPEEAAACIVAGATLDRLRNIHHMEPEDLQVLSPMKKRGPLGTVALNEKLRSVLNPDGGALAHFDGWRLGDRVIFTRNNYAEGYLNGDQGTVVGDDKPEKGGAVLLVDVAGQLVRVPKLEAVTDMQLGYAITVHKSQGSEWPMVVLVCHTTHHIMLQRDLLYTAITRGKTKVIIVGTRKALGVAIRETGAAERQTLLQGMLR